MTLTLLLDLDDTLLVNPMADFVPAYLQKLSRHLASFANPDKVIHSLLAGTQRMVENQQPDCTLKEVFDSVFYPALAISPDDLQPVLEDYYANVYPSLASLVHPRPGALQLVEQAFERGYRVAIATNPLFPLTAIEQRLQWAGFSPEQYPFALVPSFESFHFSKPNPAYLAEFLARLGWPEGPVVMVGDDFKNDIQTARQLGLPAFWLKDGAPPPLADGDPLLGSGNLENVLDWIDQQPAHLLEPSLTRPSALIAILRSTPAVLNTFCRNLDPQKWVTRPEPGEWCSTEIVCHLRDVESEVNLPRIRKVLHSTNPFIPGVDTDPWAINRSYISQDGFQALLNFSATRLRLLHMLDELTPEQWKRPARHAIFGPTHLNEMVDIISGHDRLHIQQLTR